MRTIALFNQKGGVGKTTTTVNLGAALAAAGKRVILVDLDPQANLTAHVGIEPESIEISTYRVLLDGIALRDAVRPVLKNLWVVPAVTDLAVAEQELVDRAGRESILRRMAEVEPVEADYVLIDCPPGLGLLSLNALVCADEVFIPMQAHFLALQGMAKLFETVSMIKAQLNEHLTISGVLFCQFESAARLTGEVTGEVEQYLEEARGKGLPWSNAIVFQTHIRRNIKLAEAPSFGKSIIDYAPSSPGAADYEVLAQEVIKMESAKKR